MTQSLKDKINLESAKSSVQTQVTSAVTSIGNAALGQAKAFANAALSAILAPALGVISGIAGAISGAISLAKRAANLLTAKAAGDSKNILDPAKDQLIAAIPALPAIPTSIPDLGAATAQIAPTLLPQLNSLSPESAMAVISNLEKVSKIIQQQTNPEPVTLVDNASDIAASLPDLNEDIPTNNIGFINNKTIKFVSQSTSVESRLTALNNLIGSTPGEKLFVREKLIALKQSSDLYEQGIDSAYVDNVSDQVGLLTLGHTIDTPALDPEDWGSAIGADAVTRLAYGPPQLYPVTSKYKIRSEIIAANQQAYQKVNKKMVYNLYRDRYNSQNFTTPDYEVARYKQGSLFGFKQLSVSNNNLGDYASIGFAKINNSLEAELSDLQVNNELISLVGYLNNLYNVNSLEEKPLYEAVVQGSNILIDNRGNRFLLPASRPDDSSVKVL